jgi:hypothetical protein
MICPAKLLTLLLYNFGYIGYPNFETENASIRKSMPKLLALSLL